VRLGITALSTPDRYLGR